MTNLEDKVLLYAPIEKTDEEKHMVYGYASTEAIDSQGEIVKKDALKEALGDYMKFANIREMHQNSAVGKTKQANLDEKGLYIAVKVVDPTAWEKVKEGVYNGFSIGGRVKQMVDNEITSLRLSEISLVDRPANPEALFDVFKADQLDNNMKKQDEPIVEEVIEEPKTEIVEEIKEEAPEEVKTEEVTPEIEEVKEEVKVEEKVEEKSEDVEMVKSLWHVSELAQLIEQLNYLEERIEDEGKRENDPLNAEHAAKVVEAMTTLSALLIEMAGTETKEILSEEKDEVVDEVEEPMELSEKAQLMKTIEDQANEGTMPTDEQISKMFDLEEIEKTDRSIAVFKNTMAGKILENIENNMQDQANKDAVKVELEKVLDEAETIVAKNENEFTKALALVDTLIKSTTSEVEALPASPDPKKEDSSDLNILVQAVSFLAMQNQGGQLTPDQEKILADGLAIVSMRFSGGHFKEENKDSNPKNKAEEADDMKKLDGEVALLKAEIEKLNNMPEPIKVKASYVIEKSEGEDKSDDLTKAETEVEVMQQKLKENPNDPTLIKQATELSQRVMKLRREV